MQQRDPRLLLVGLHARGRLLQRGEPFTQRGEIDLPREVLKQGACAAQYDVERVAVSRENRCLRMEGLAAPRSLVKNPLVCAGLHRALAFEQTIFAQRINTVTCAKRVETLR